ncbi:hypothetical protein [Pseudonocardia sp. MH-G8]|uniref:hypothetical protein n=1 Tax=Pseudonocardia sp. MH-G8 TaxID=1854588 RepID=UPI001E28AACC|nr:hypothetical protein [Pseudonocardia sp. MH-G8]
MIDRIWAQVSAPRARADVTGFSDVTGALDVAAAALADPGRQAADRTGAGRASGGGDDGEDRAGRHADGPRGGHPHDGHGERGGQDGGDSGEAGQVEHDEHGGMELPGGLPMADLGEDRDGLMLDRLHVSLGPVLPDWPSGLVVHLLVQGDVIQEARAEVLDRDHGAAFWNADNAVVRELDGIGRFLAVAGWADESARARRVRDALLAGAPTEQVAGVATATVRRLRRSRTLRWLVGGIGTGTADVSAQLEARLAAVEAAMTDRATAPPTHVAADALPDLLVGAEFAAARLIVAVLDPDTEPVETREGVLRG